MFTDGLDDDLGRLKETSELLRGKGKCRESSHVGPVALSGTQMFFPSSRWRWTLLSLPHGNPTDGRSVPTRMIPRLPLCMHRGWSGQKDPQGPTSLTLTKGLSETGLTNYQPGGVRVKVPCLPHGEWVLFGLLDYLGVPVSFS